MLPFNPESLIAQSGVHYLTGFRGAMAKGGYCGFHEHAAMELVYHPDGVGVTRAFGGEPLSYGPGTLVVYPRGCRHDEKVFESGSDFCVQIEVVVSGGDTGAAVVLPSIGRFVREEMASLSLGGGGLDGASASTLNLRAIALLSAVRDEMRKPRSPGAAAQSADDYVRQATRLMEESPERYKTTAEIAKAVGVSPDYLRHLFTSSVSGATLSQTLARIRLCRAQALLANSPLPLKAIAASCGYANERHLCAVFKRLTGSTPGSVRSR